MPCACYAESPGFALTAVLSLALGIGANTAVFSLVNGVLLRSLPYPDADRLVRVGQGSVSIPQLEFTKEHSSSFAFAAGHRGGGDISLTFGAQHEWIKFQLVTADFFSTLGVSPVIGREFHVDETRPNGPQAIVLSDGLWRRSFASDPAILGRVVTLETTNYTVVGVLPRAFWFPDAADAFVPLRPSGSATDRGSNTAMIARLRPGISRQQAGAEITAITGNYRGAIAGDETADYRTLTLIPYQEWLVGDVRLKLLLLLGAVGFLLLIACSNIASLLLARLAARQKEIAIRLALGCGRGRLLRQFMMENLLLSLTGGITGLFAAYWALDTLLALTPFDLPASSPIRVDSGVLGFTLAIALATGVLFSLVPLLTSARLDLQTMLRATGRSGGAGTRQRTRSFLVVTEVAFSVTLLIAAALLIQSLYRLHQERLGFTPRGLITFWTRPPAGGFKSAADRWNFQSTLLERLQAMPGVHKAAAVNLLPLTGQNNFPSQREGHPEQSIGGMEIRLVTPAYFETMGIAVLRGRSFSGRDTAGALPVLAVNETLARQWWAQNNPLGDRIVIGRFRGQDYGKPAAHEVVAVVADTKTVFLKAPARPTVYIPDAQAAGYDIGMDWVVRADLTPGFADLVRRTVAEAAPSQNMERLRTMEEVVASTTADSRFDAWLFGGFAGLALLLTSIGVYGLLAFSVAHRTNEIGTRMALGASRADVLRLILRQGVALLGIGLVIGLTGALALSRVISQLLFGVRPTDPLSFLAVSALLLCVGLFASYIPARRATKVDPMVALRHE